MSDIKDNNQYLDQHGLITFWREAKKYIDLVRGQIRVYLTEEKYNALGSSKLTDGKDYYLTNIKPLINFEDVNNKYY